LKKKLKIFFSIHVTEIHRAQTSWPLDNGTFINMPAMLRPQWTSGVFVSHDKMV